MTTTKDSSKTRVEINALRALTNWKFEFSDAVRKHAKQIAKDAGHPELITALDYQRAAKFAVEQLTFAISETPGEESDGEQKAA